MILMIRTDPRECQPGDLLKFPSGRVRMVVDRYSRGLTFVQIKDGVIGNYRAENTKPHWKQTKVADGRTLTNYTWFDLRRLFR